jgi:hypothetical protein
MQHSLFKNIFPNYKRKLDTNTHITIKSYSNNQIQVFGQCTTAVKFEKGHDPIDLTLTIIQDIDECKVVHPSAFYHQHSEPVSEETSPVTLRVFY